ncbi:hypothetical protein [Amaricoccus sp.]|uniref:hypothetical protein n=1 Tax=Amaricoccus sp. TaxID=1872485 RepID=UPI001B718724|nr:hypothetical protein [Amaricoccus sp.]MBP7242658.1 hypothetical protein [Amaricoccus sp.]
MTTKLAILLLAVALLASLLARGRKARPPTRAVEAARKCPECGAWVVAGARCDCEGA